jgi:TM2 domain-containing membrane protein YozV
MAKIVSIENDIVEIGEDNGNLLEVRRVDLNFEPRVGDAVDIFRNEGKIKIVPSNSSNSNVSQTGQGININLTQSVNQQGTNPIYVATGKVVNKTVYCLLCFFVGWLGVHKFYAGKVGMGILYIFTVGLFGIGVFVDLIVGLLKKADANGNIII